MRKYIYIGLGGFLGACLRYTLRAIRIENYQGQFPINTLLVNLAGCFLLAMLFTRALEVLEISSNLRLGVTTGFIGAFTTFSTLCKEITVMALAGFYGTAFSYAILSIFLGLAVSYLGYVLAWIIISRQKVKKTNIPVEYETEGREES